MQFAETEICRIATEIWSSVLGLPLQRREAFDLPQGAPLLTGRIEIRGAWEGAVAMQCSLTFARTATSRMLRLKAREAAEEEIRDAIGELANILGGNVKEFLPAPSQISLPEVTDGDVDSLQRPNGRLLSRLDFSCEGHPIRVAVVQHGQRGRHSPAVVRSLLTTDYCP
jgi:chemotaxis protein CheX